MDVFFEILAVAILRFSRQENNHLNDCRELAQNYKTDDDNGDFINAMDKISNALDDFFQNFQSV